MAPCTSKNAIFKKIQQICSRQQWRYIWITTKLLSTTLESIARRLVCKVVERNPTQSWDKKCVWCFTDTVATTRTKPAEWYYMKPLFDDSPISLCTWARMHERAFIFILFLLFFCFCFLFFLFWIVLHSNVS